MLILVLVLARPVLVNITEPFQAKINNQKMLPLGAIFEPKIHQNAFAARGASVVYTGRPLHGRGKEEGMGRGVKEGKRRWSIPPISFLQFNHCP